MMALEPRLNLIAAMCKSNRGIGLANDLPWRGLRKEFAYFSRMTTHTRDPSKRNAIVMGRRTWESLPKRPLPNRINVVISRQLAKCPQGADHLARDLRDALRFCQARDDMEQVWIVGGTQLYAESLRSAHFYRLYLTEIDGEFECDTFFPDVDPTMAMQAVRDDAVSDEVQEEKGVTYRFKVYERA